MTLSASILKPKTPPKQLIVILHGWGADGANLIDLADMFAQWLPEAVFLAPNAPTICEVNPYGYQWFSLQDRSPARMTSGVREAAVVVNDYLDALQKEYGIDNAHTALVGFSQGTMTALEVALKRAPALACVVGFSGLLVNDAGIASKPPVCLIHGAQDPVVPFGSMAHAEKTLKAAGVPVETHARPNLGHSIDMEGLEASAQFLERHLR